MFGGGSSQPAEQQQADNAVASQANDNYQSNSWGPRSCENDAKSFTKCLDENQGNMQICGWYLEQLVSFLNKNIQSTMLISCAESLPVGCESILGWGNRWTGPWCGKSGNCIFEALS